MHVIDERLAQWAAHASRPPLRAGPTVVDLGGLDALLAAADHLAQGPFLHHLIQATAHHLDAFGTEACRPLYDAVLNGLNRCWRRRDPGSEDPLAVPGRPGHSLE